MNHRWIIFASLLLNVALLLAATGVYAYHRSERSRWRADARSGAAYAGTATANADHDAGIERYFQLETIPGGAAEVRFDRKSDDGAEVWLWLTPKPFGEGSSAVPVRAFVDAYNDQMRIFLISPTTRPAN